MLDARDDTVAVQRFLDVRRRDVEILLAGAVGHDEAVARRVHLEAPDDDIHPIGEAEAVAPDLEQLAFRDKRLQQPPERRAVLARHPEQLEQLARRGRVGDAIADLAQEFVAGQHSRIG